VAAENVVLVRRLEGDPVEGFTKTRVMGLGGCMLISDEPLGVESPLEVLLSFAGRVVRTRGRVAYENPNGFEEYEVGVEFLELDPDDREYLRRFLAGAD
jgi:hypothetical protein